VTTTEPRDEQREDAPSEAYGAEPARAPEGKLRPYDACMLDVGDGHWIYVEEVGRADGIPALFLHGGPGSGSQHAHRALFDPQRFRALLLDQRGAGRSHPHLSLEANTTQHLVADIERIREHLRIERWFLVGGSWGSTLALAYAERFPQRVMGLVLRAIFLGTREEVAWAFVEGPKIFRPDLYADFIGYLPEDERADPLAAYLARLSDPDREVKGRAARIWNAYERTLSTLNPSRSRLEGEPPTDGRLPPTPIVEAHYIRNGFFLEPGQLLRDARLLKGIPGHIVQGRYDLLCPPKNAYALCEAWPDCRLEIIEGAGHDMGEPGVAPAMAEALRRLASGG
jgi:proline iminopeptidase